MTDRDLKILLGVYFAVVRREQPTIVQEDSRILNEEMVRLLGFAQTQGVEVAPLLEITHQAKGEERLPWEPANYQAVSASIQCLVSWALATGIVVSYWIQMIEDLKTAVSAAEQRTIEEKTLDVMED